MSVSATEDDCSRLDHSPPLATYGHELGCSVTGGVVYRGAELPWAVGRVSLRGLLLRTRLGA